MKINKWGIKRERIMGIDGEAITNTIPTKNSTTFLGMVRSTTHVSESVRPPGILFPKLIAAGNPPA